jgi:hypothetical protein
MCGTSWETKTNEMGFSYENRHDSPWDTTIQDEKVIAFSY